MMTSEKISIKGSGRIYLGELYSDEVTADYPAWLNDTQVTQYLESRFYPQNMGSIRHFVEDCAIDTACLFLAVRVVATDKHIGNIKLHRMGSRRAFEKAGYVLEGTRREQYMCDGQYFDAFILGKTAKGK